VNNPTGLIAISGCDNANRIGDVIFVHGLGGDARGTWHPHGKSSDNDFWPAWLGEELSDMGIWSLGYEVEPFKWKGNTMPLVDRATNTLAVLDSHEIGVRPLIFITHSLGGLLVKQMLRHAWDYGTPEWKLIVEQTRGVVFLSTPHSGSNMANWVKYIGVILQASVSVDELEAHHSRLRELNEVYRNHEWLSQIPIQVYCEKQKTSGFLVVDETSANPGIKGVTPIPMDDDHLSICRPSSRESLLYRRVREFIKKKLPSPHRIPIELKEKSVGESTVHPPGTAESRTIVSAGNNSNVGAASDFIAQNSIINIGSTTTNILVKEDYDYFKSQNRDLHTVNTDIQHLVSTFFAIRHHSFELLTNRILKDSLPVHLQHYKIQHIEFNQSPFFTGNTYDPLRALRQINELINVFFTLFQSNNENAVIGYYGIVHIPLQFSTGYAVSTWPKITLFELDRNTNCWYELAIDDSPQLKLSVSTISRPVNAVAVVIRIAISFDISKNDVDDIVPQPYQDIQMKIGKRRIDAITHYSQIKEVCSAFRQVLDDLHTRVDKSLIVHIFYAGPVCLGFSLGRQISRTIHHQVIVYNYTAHTSPRYAWGVKINSVGSPKSKVVSTKLLIHDISK